MIWLRLHLMVASLLAVSAQAQSISERDLDLACAVTSGAEMGATSKGSPEQSAALLIFTFYLGRLSARDQKTYWNDVIRGRVEELREGARSKTLYADCMDFYISQVK